MPAYPFERQPAAGRETFDLRGTGEHHHRSTGQHLVILACLPLAFDFVQLQYVMVSQHLNIAVQGLEPAQRRRVDPATFGVEQATMGQLDPGQRLGLWLIKQMHQCRCKGLSQLCLTLGFLGAKAQLQHATVVPVTPALQVFQQATGVAEATDNHL